MYILWKKNLMKFLRKRKIFFSKCMKYLIFWTLSLRMETRVSASLQHQFTNFKKWYSKKRLDAALLNASWIPPRAHYVLCTPDVKVNPLVVWLLHLIVSDTQNRICKTKNGSWNQILDTPRIHKCIYKQYLSLHQLFAVKNAIGK